MYRTYPGSTKMNQKKAADAVIDNKINGRFIRELLKLYFNAV